VTLPDCHWCGAKIGTGTAHRPLECLDGVNGRWNCLVTGTEVMVIDGCPLCGGVLARSGFSQPALFRHGGYGEVRHHEAMVCACGWSGNAGYRSLNPRAVA